MTRRVPPARRWPGTARLARAIVGVTLVAAVATLALATVPGWTRDSRAAGPSQDGTPSAPLAFPLVARGANLRSPAATPPPTAVPATASPTPLAPPTSSPTPPPASATSSLATNTPTVAITPTATATAGPGVPACSQIMGDAGGFRFSLDGGATLAPNARPLAPVAYTWDLDVDPRDPNVVLELHQGVLYESTDAGCTFAVASRPGDWDQLVRAPSRPELLVATSVFRSALAYSEDGGHTWAPEETLPSDVFGLDIAAADPWHWTFVGRDGVLYERPSRDVKWAAYSVTGAAGQGVTAAVPAPGQPGRWLVGTSGSGLFRTDDNGRTWQAADRDLRGEVGSPPEPVTALVVASATFAASDPDVAYVVVNRVGRQESQRGIWRTEDGGDTWSLQVADGRAVADRVAEITGGTRVFVSPRDPDHVLFAYGMGYQAYGTDLFRSHDGLATLEVNHFDGFYEVFALAFGPPQTEVLLLGTSSDIPSW